MAGDKYKVTQKETDSSHVRSNVAQKNSRLYRRMDFAPPLDLCAFFALLDLLRGFATGPFTELQLI